MHNLKLLALGVLPLCFQSTSASSAFDPKAYQKSTATCQATNRAEGQDTAVEINLRNFDSRISLHRVTTEF